MTDALDGILRLLPDRSATTRLKQNELEVLLDVRTGKVVKERPRFAFWRQGSLVTYVVTVERLQELRPLSLVLRGLDDPDARLEVKIACHVQCPSRRDCAETLVAALVTEEHPNPEAALSAILVDAAGEFEARLRAKQLDPVRNFCDRREEWEDELVRRLQRRTGLDVVTLRMTVDAEVSQVRFSDPVVAQLSDCEERVEVRFVCDLLIDDHSRATAAQARDGDLGAAIQRGVADWIRTSVPVGSALVGFPEIHSRILGEVQRLPMLREMGRRVDAVEDVSVRPLFELESSRSHSIKKMQIDLRDCDARAEVDLMVNLSVADARQALELDKSGRSPTTAYLDFVRRWAVEACDVRWILNEPAEAEAALKEAFSDYVGGFGLRVDSLKADFRPRFEFESRIVSESRSLQVTLEGGTTRASAQYEVELVVQDLPSAVRSYPERRRWLRALDEEVQEFCKQLSLESLYAETELVNLRLQEHLARATGVLAVNGWSLHRLESTIERPFELPSSLPIEHVSKCIIASEGSQTIKIRHTFRIEVVNVALLAREKNMVGWVKKRLDDLTQELVLKLTYLEVIRGFGLLASEVSGGAISARIGTALELKIQSEAKERGCNVQQFSSILNEEISSLLSLGVDDDAGIHEYETKKAGVLVKFGINISGQLLDLNKLEKRGLLRQGVRLRGEILEAARRAAARVIHALEPSAFYARFSAASVAAGSEGGLGHGEEARDVDIQKQIGNAVSSQLREELGLEATVHIKRAETQFTEWLSDIYREEGEVTVRVELGDIQKDLSMIAGVGQEATKDARAQFRVQYKVLGADPEMFHLLEAKDHSDPGKTLEGLEVAIKGALLERTQFMPSKFIEYRDQSHKEELKAYLFDGIVDDEKKGEGVKDVILRAFGLRVDITAFYLEESSVKALLAIADKRTAARDRLVDEKHTEQITASLDNETEEIKAGVRVVDVAGLKGDSDSQDLVDRIRREERGRLDASQGGASRRIASKDEDGEKRKDASATDGDSS